MHPSFEQFVAALQDPAQRAAIRLVIDDEAATALLSRADWATDYYQRWLALFPAVEVAAPPAAPAPPSFVAPPAPTSPYGPPPTGAPTSGPVAAPGALSFSRDPAVARGALAAAHPAAVDPWTANGFDGPPRPRSRARTAIIVLGAAVGVLLLVLGGVAVAGVVGSHSETSDASATTPSSGASPTAPATSTDDVFFHGLTKRQYDLLEATLMSTGTSLEDGVAHGTTDAFIRALSDDLDAKTEKACGTVADVDGGFSNETYRTSFMAGYESTTHCTDDQAMAVYQAVEEYCDAD